MGHNGYLSESYRRFTKEQAYELYQASEHNLYINEVDVDKIESKYVKELEISKENLKEMMDKQNKQHESNMESARHTWEDSQIDILNLQKEIQYLIDKDKQREKDKLAFFREMRDKK
jgi:hypothetical protein